MQHIGKLFAVLLIVFVQALDAQIKHGLRDEQGRHVIPRGFVVNTNDALGPIEFDADDYVRMVRMGANYQVVRLEIGRVSTFPGCQVEESYMQKLESLVELGKHAGIKTVFKMTVYGPLEFSWEAFWANEKNEQQIYLDAWKGVWERFKDVESVVGYDLVNEPRKLTMDISYNDLTNDYLIPYYQTLIDAGSEISDSKLFLCQTIFMNKGEAIKNNQYAEITKPIERENVVFAPHIYQNDIDLIEPTMQRFDKESDLLEAPVFIGEWGFPTLETTDSSVQGQLDYKAYYIRTAEIFDRMGVGSIKAWFMGTRAMQDFLPEGRSTWAIFRDEHVAAGTIERKYITDIISRPFPQVIAGTIDSFMFNHATRVLDMSIRTDNSQGSSRVFVAANRHYPDGFSIHCGDEMILAFNPLRPQGLEVIKASANSNPADFIWVESRQQLVILKWPEDQAELNLKIVPGISWHE